ncbi:hypothetical protein [Haladaptatus sp. DYSN1]|uniref:hypothetical protein n=1 Tax=unclassified Haladaptatus TaxID=2622732 RepID=UPI002404E56C|nr:hypothetical protein [Haladaptatus sp. DYSN1]
MTRNHDYNTPAKGATDWHIPLNQNFESLDRDVEIRDVDANLTDYEPKQDAKFLATDTGNVYIGDGASWNPLPVGQQSGGSGGSGVQFPDVIVYKDGSTVRAEGRNGEIASGTNPSAVIVSAIEQGDHVQIVGDYTLTEKIFLNNQTEKTINAAEASFRTDDEIKLWEFYDSNWCRFTVGELDCGQNGLVGLDVHATKGLQADVRFNYVGTGTFTEDDGVNPNGTYDKCAVRLKSLGGQKGCYYNRIRATRTYGDVPAGKGIVLCNTEGETKEKPNGNSIYPIHWNTFSKAIEIKQGFRNAIHQPEIGSADIGLHIHEGPQTIHGDGWIESSQVGIRIESESPSGVVGGTLTMVGGVSFGGTTTDIEGTDHVNWNDNHHADFFLSDGYHRRGYVEFVNEHEVRWNSDHDLQGNRLKGHAEGSTDSDPTGQGPAGWLEIETGSGETRYLPYYE